MFYPGLRSSRVYLDKLYELSNSKTQIEYNVITVAGGGAFLQGLNASAKELYVIDTEGDCLNHAKLIIELIKISSSIHEFFYYLSGHILSDDLSHFTLSISDGDPLTRFRAQCVDLNLIDIFTKCYSGGCFDLSTGILDKKDFNIHFFGLTLRPMNFNWMIGEGAFSSEQSYQSLRSILNNLTIHYNLISFNYIYLAPLPFGKALPSLILASNCESPLFDRGDSIFRYLNKNSPTPSLYLSWNRSCLLGLENRICMRKEFEGTPPQENPFLVESNLRAAKTKPGTDSLIFKDAVDLRTRGRYGERSALLYYSDDISNDCFEDILEALAPAVKYVGIKTVNLSSNLMERLKSSGFTESYTIYTRSCENNEEFILAQLKGLDGSLTIEDALNELSKTLVS